MSNQLITSENNERVKSFLLSLDRLFPARKLTLHGESFYTDEELSKKLKISRRSLQDYRNEGRIPYVKLGGKYCTEPRILKNCWRMATKRVSGSSCSSHSSMIIFSFFRLINIPKQQGNKLDKTILVNTLLRNEKGRFGKIRCLVLAFYSLLLYLCSDEN